MLPTTSKCHYLKTKRIEYNPAHIERHGHDKQHTPVKEESVFDYALVVNMGGQDLIKNREAHSYSTIIFLAQNLIKQGIIRLAGIPIQEPFCGANCVRF